jgi:signal transduction histidine kinase
MNAPVVTLEELVHEALDRLRQQEARLAALEAARPASSSSAETVIAPWPKRAAPRPSNSEAPPAPPVPAPAPDRAELEARLAEAEQRAREAEAVLRGAVNLATAGRVAAGMAHDFHNLLGVIAGNADLLREGLPPDGPYREQADTIARTAQAVAAISRKVMSVGRPSAPHLVPLDVSVAIRAIEPILRGLVGKPVALHFDLAPGLPLIRADATEFDRALLNLVLNARDASATGGGTIAVRAARAERASGPHVAVTVSDTGCGMSAEVRKRMFDLFFTTKGDRGTGLGLVTVRDAVTAVGGCVEVESEVGWGTQVRVYWPALGE